MKVIKILVGILFICLLAYYGYYTYTESYRVEVVEMDMKSFVDTKQIVAYYLEGDDIYVDFALRKGMNHYSITKTKAYYKNGVLKVYFMDESAINDPYVRDEYIYKIKINDGFQKVDFYYNEEKVESSKIKLIIKE